MGLCSLLSFLFSVFSLLSALFSLLSSLCSLLSSLFSLLSSLFSLLSSLFSLLSLLLDPGKCKPCCSTVVHYFYKGLPASLCALPSSLLGPDPFLYHPALLGPNHLSSLSSL